MAKINNRGVLKRIEKDAFVSPGIESVPSELANTVQPVLISNPEQTADVLKNFAGTGGGTSTIYTTPSDTDFYLTNLQLAIRANAACDTATGSWFISAVVGGGSNRLLGVAVITATDQEGHVSMNFVPPLKIDKNSVISLSHTVSTAVTAGVISKFVSLTGYNLQPL